MLDDQGLDEGVLAVVVQVQQGEEALLGGEVGVDGVDVGHVEASRSHGDVEEGLADALVDLAVEVEGVGLDQVEGGGRELGGGHEGIVKDPVRRRR